jgi:hypothetical protein
MMIDRPRLHKLAGASMLFTLVALSLATWWTYRSIDHGMEIMDRLTDSQQMAITQYLASRGTLAGTSLTLLGGFAALFLYTGNRIRIRTTYQKFLFGGVLLLIAGSYVAYYVGYEFLLQRMYFRSSFDLGAPIIQLWAGTQLRFLIAGLIWAIVTVVLCYRIDPEPKEGV